MYFHLGYFFFFFLTLFWTLITLQYSHIYNIEMLVGQTVVLIMSKPAHGHPDGTLFFLLVLSIHKPESPLRVSPPVWLVCVQERVGKQRVEAPYLSYAGRLL